jgi:hypothetical protein
VLLSNPFLPKINSYWIHKNGCIYVVEDHIKDEDNNVMILYRSLIDNERYCRSPSAFIRSRVELPI